MSITNNIEYGLICKFLKDNSFFFLPQLEKQGVSLVEYAYKLSKFATVSYVCKDTSCAEKIVGAVIGYTRNTPDNYSYITQVFVIPECRKQGLAGLLLNDYLEYCRSIDLDGVWLTTEKNNFNAQNLYKNNGFKIVDRDYNDYLVKMEISF